MNFNFLNTLGKLPWMLFVVAFLLTVQYMDVSLEGTVGYAFISFAIFALFVEMFKSGNVGAMSFLLDQFWAVLTVMLAAALLTYLWFVEETEPSFFHWIGFAVIVADAFLNPFNAYRTAMRNFDVPG